MRPRILGLRRVVGLVILTAASAAHAQTDLWARMAEQDLSAARDLIAANHPAAAPGSDDLGFNASLHAGYSSTLGLAAQVRSYEGYRAVLQRFAAGFRDRHILSRPLLDGPQRWPGLMVSLGEDSSSEDWRVTASVDQDGLKLGSRLISCDGVEALKLAEARLRPTVSNWDIAAQRKRSSWRLLVDDGDPFVSVPKRCTFEEPSGQRVDHVLNWRTIPANELDAHMRIAVGRPAAAVSLTPLENGWWLRLGTLIDDARPVVEEVAHRSAELRGSRFIVVDLRGNGGGSSIYSQRIAETLYGKEHTASVLKRIAVGPDGETWRASAGNLETIEQYVQRFSKQLGADDPLVNELKRIQAAVSRAVRDGQSLVTTPREDVKSAAQRNKAQPRIKIARPVVVLFTDRFCFSSCLMAAQLFRELGALHVGEETDQNTHYTEVRSITLPSGLSTFSTLQAIDTAYARTIGPFTPSMKYVGRTDDDAAVRVWMKQQVLHGR